MSVLMTLKYPVSFPPKLEELQALPEHVFKQWTKEIKIKILIPLRPTLQEEVYLVYHELCRFFNKHNDCRVKDLEVNIQKLRTRIYNMDE